MKLSQHTEQHRIKHITTLNTILCGQLTKRLEYVGLVVLDDEAVGHHLVHDVVRLLDVEPDLREGETRKSEREESGKKDKQS